MDKVLEGEEPDLVIIAFGMNDGTNKISPEQYAANISAMIEKVEAANTAAELILVAPMLANPDTYFAGNQAEYAAALQSIAATRAGTIAVADLTAVHQQLLRYKNYADLTGNNVNHPNDFLIRCYAQVLLTTIIEEIRH